MRKLDDFLRLSGREVLQHAGRITAEAAQNQAEAVFEAYRQQQRALPSRAEQDFEAALLQPVKLLQQHVNKAKTPENPTPPQPSRTPKAGRR